MTTTDRYCLTPTRLAQQVAAQHETATVKQVSAALILLDDGNTVPFIARYRQEATQFLTDSDLYAIHKLSGDLRDLARRKQTVHEALSQQKQLTPELITALQQATTSAAVAAIYAPYKKTRQTKADQARQKGYGPLAQWLWRHQSADAEDYRQRVAAVDRRVSETVGREHLLAILVADVAQNQRFRAVLQERIRRHGRFVTKQRPQATDPQGVFKRYADTTFTYAELHAHPHQVLAINRGDQTKVLTVSLRFPEERALFYLRQQLLTEAAGPVRELLITAIQLAYRQSLLPIISRHLRHALTTTAQSQAIQVFGRNLQQLLLQRPLRQHVIMGFDPGYRTGAKIAIVDQQGTVQTTTVIYPVAPASAVQQAEAAEQFEQLLAMYQVTVVAIGNGTASRESAAFVAEHLPANVRYTLVDEAGASVYSASALAREEFPDLPITQRSAVSIARRLQDPLAELIKIDPKAIGVGQYQHDLPEHTLDQTVRETVDRAVHAVGADLNTASSALLQYIAGLTPRVARNVVAYREMVGGFANRRDLLKVPQLGPKAFEQAVGFLRIIGGHEPLDATTIHPESYADVRRLLTLCQGRVGDQSLHQKAAAYGIARLATALQQPERVIQDWLTAVMTPAADIRETRPQALLKSDVRNFADLRVGMTLQGTVRNIVDFGAFIDLGVKHDGLLHVSQIARQPHQALTAVLAIGEIVEVTITTLDSERQRIGLTRTVN